MSLNQNTNPFQIVEASISDLHVAIQNGSTTCVATVEQYIARCAAYNNPSSLLVTKDGKSIAPSPGTIRAKKAISFPTQTVCAEDLLPDLNQYQGKQNSTVDQNVYDELLDQFRKHHLLVGNSKTPKEERCKNITKEHIHLFLKELEYSKHYENVNLIHYQI